MKNSEEAEHLFGSCSYFSESLQVLESSVGFIFSWNEVSFEENLKRWFNVRPVNPVFICYVFWEVWRARNQAIFRGHKTTTPLMAAKILHYYFPVSVNHSKMGCRTLSFSELDYCFPLGYFDGVAQDGVCGARMILKMSLEQVFHLSFGVGVGSNMRAELLSLWGLLWFAKREGCCSLTIFGDSQCVVNWADGRNSLFSMDLYGWILRTRALISSFSSISFRHVY